MKSKPDPVVKNIDTAIRFRYPISERDHHSFYEEVLEDAMKALGGGTDFHWAGDNEGRIMFLAAGWNFRDTSLVSGADGMTNYMTVTATYTAPETTVITLLHLVGTKNSRVSAESWSSEAVSQSLILGQDYIINWTIHADI
jgi:hypothetical protein